MGSLGRGGAEVGAACPAGVDAHTPGQGRPLPLELQGRLWIGSPALRPEGPPPGPRAAGRVAAGPQHSREECVPDSRAPCPSHRVSLSWAASSLHTPSAWAARPEQEPSQAAQRAWPPNPRGFRAGFCARPAPPWKVSTPLPGPFPFQEGSHCQGPSGSSARPRAGAGWGSGGPTPRAGCAHWSAVCSGRPTLPRAKSSTMWLFSPRAPRSRPVSLRWQLGGSPRPNA